MKKILISASFDASSLSLEEIKSCLEKLGVTQVVVEHEVNTVSSDGNDLPRHIWLHVSDEGVFKVSNSGLFDFAELSADEVARLRSDGVCTEFFAYYPRAENYGVPAYVSSDDAAAVIACKYGFVVPDNGLHEVRSTDTRDDSAEEIWLKIALPA
ncbi:hypothetical protein ACI2KR_06675 [Pseudomonas luteola]